MGYFFFFHNFSLKSTTQLRPRRRRRLRNLHTDPSLLSFSSVGTVFTILHASLSSSLLPFCLRSPLSAAKYANPAGKGAELYGARPFLRPSVCPPNGHSIAFWRSKLEFILVLRRFRAPSSSSSFSLRPLFSVPVPPSSSSSSPLFASYPYAANHAASMGGISRSLPLLLSS